jgi:hypothetical protein
MTMVSDAERAASTLPLVFRCAPTPGEQFRAGWATLRHGRHGGILAAAGVAVVLLFPVAAYLRFGASGAAWALVALAWVLALVTAGGYWQARRYVRSNPAFTSEHVHELAPDGYRVRNPTGDLLVAWEGIVRTAESREFFLLYPGRAHAFFFPKHAVPRDRLDEVRAFLAAHAGRPAGTADPAPLASPADASAAGSVSVTFQHDEPEAYRATYSVAARGWPGWIRWIVWLGLILVPVLAVWIDVSSGATVREVLRENVGLIIMAGFVVAGLLLERWGVRQVLRGSLGAGPHTIAFSEDGVRSANAATASLARWESILQVRETPEFVLLYYGHKRAAAIPKRAIAEGDLPRLCALLRAHVRGPVRLADDPPAG